MYDNRSSVTFFIEMNALPEPSQLFPMYADTLQFLKIKQLGARDLFNLFPKPEHLSGSLIHVRSHLGSASLNKVIFKQVRGHLPCLGQQSSQA